MPLSRLNKEQYQAATAHHGHNLIIASAGTGKTSTIVARIAHLLQNATNPSKILLLTFTNKAANEMISRLSRYFDKSITQAISAGTFHSISYKHLKSLDPSISIKQAKDLKTLLKSVVEKREFSHLNSETQAYKAIYLYDLFSLYQNSELKLSFSEWLSTKNSEHDSFSDIYEDIFEEFKELKQKYKYYDFNDLLINATKSFQISDIEYDEILVDEFQDTNILQNAFINSISHKSLFCVGDYDQSIYAFNGADIEIIGGFKSKYTDATIFNLSKNYRSTKSILHLASTVINHNERLYDKKLEVMRNDSDISPRLLVFDELYDQYNSISQKILNSQTPQTQIAVIFRNNSSADGIEVTLRELGIACKRKGSMSFFDSREVKAILSLLSILTNPKDVMAFIHIVEFAKNIGAAIAKEIYDGLEILGDGNIIEGILKPKEVKENIFAKKITNYQLGLFDHPQIIGSISGFSNLGFEEKFLANPILKHPKLSKDSATFLHHLYEFIKINHKLKSPSTITNNIMHSKIFKEITNILSTQRSIQKDGSIDQILKEESTNNIMRKAMLIFKLSKNHVNKQNFLNTLTLAGAEMSEGDGVNLLTVHSAKGLEFEEVYIIDLMDGRFPNTKLMNQTGSIEEERRLFYVATTRAKDILYLSYAKYDKIKRQDFIHSQFLKEAGMIK